MSLIWPLCSTAWPGVMTKIPYRWKSPLSPFLRPRFEPACRAGWPIRPISAFVASLPPCAPRLQRRGGMSSDFVVCEVKSQNDSVRRHQLQWFKQLMETCKVVVVNVVSITKRRVGK